VTIVAVYVGIVVLLAIFQARLVYFPTRGIEATPDSCGLSYEAVTLKASDGTELSGWFVPANDARATLLFCHGNAGNISHRLDSLLIFHRLRLSTFIFDYRGYGQSQGSASEKGTYLDAQAAWDHLVNVRKVPPDHVVVFGRSLGGPIAAWAAKENSPEALILESTFTSLPDVGARLYPWLPVRLISRFRYSTRDHVRQVKCPLLVIHSPDDELIPYALGRKVFEAANEPKEFLEITGPHNGGFLESGKRYTKGLNAFLSKLLEK
jgi:fermentation-respiration switch protein FrsA (DUF1100 family)